MLRQVGVSCRRRVCTRLVARDVGKRVLGLGRRPGRVRQGFVSGGGGGDSGSSSSMLAKEEESDAEVRPSDRPP